MLCVCVCEISRAKKKQQKLERTDRPYRILLISHTQTFIEEDIAILQTKFNFFCCVYSRIYYSTFDKYATIVNNWNYIEEQKEVTQRWSKVMMMMMMTMVVVVWFISTMQQHLL